MLLKEAAIIIARTGGDQNDDEAKENAKESLRSAIRDFNAANNWEFKFTIKDDYVLAAGQQDIVIEGLKRVHTIRTVLPTVKTLRFARLRLIDYTTREQSTNSDPVVYVTIDGPESNTIRVYPPCEATTTFQVRYYAEIEEPELDDDIIDVPKRYLTALITRAKYHYLLDYDTEAARCDKTEALSEVLLRKAIKDDKKQPDEIVQMVSRAEYGSAFGYLDDDIDFHPSDLM